MTACNTCGEPGRYLCPRHASKLGTILTDLPTLYAELAHCLVPRRYGFGEIVSTKGAAGPRSPLDEDVLDDISPGGIEAVVHSWRVDVQRVRWPHHSAPPSNGLAADCRWLAMELDWIAVHYPGAVDLAGEIRALEARARDIVGDPVPRRKLVGQCIATDDQGTVCGADITHRAGESRLQCQACRTVYEGEQQLLLLLYYQPVTA